jgi:hypothetical protein
VNKKVICVTGTRTHERDGECAYWLDKLQPDLVLVGDASGIDAEARAWAKKNKKALMVFCATTGWPSAGPKRNHLMAWTASLIQKSHPDTSFIAFPHGEAKGTSSCIQAMDRHVVGGFVHGEKQEPPVTIPLAKPRSHE